MEQKLKVADNILLGVIENPTKEKVTEFLDYANEHFFSGDIDIRVKFMYRMYVLMKCKDTNQHMIRSKHWATYAKSNQDVLIKLDRNNPEVRKPLIENVIEFATSIGLAEMFNNKGGER